MFSRLFDSFFNEYIEDEVFGRLRRGKSVHFGDHDYWEARIYFEPVKDEIGVYFWGREDKISDKQKEFYREFEARYSSFVEEIEELIYTRYIEFGGDWQRQDVSKICRLESLSIPSTISLNSEYFEYDLGYTYGSTIQGFLIEMKNWKSEECWAGDSLALDNERDR